MMKTYYLRPHHLRDLERLRKYNKLRMFISNLIWYGWKEAIYRHKLFKEMNKQKEFRVEVSEGTRDQICLNCSHMKYCATGHTAFRNKRMKLYETVLLKGKQHNPIIADQESLKNWD